MIKELWYLLIEGQTDKQTGIFGNFYAYGTHLGEVVEKTLKAAAEYHFHGAELIEASLLTNFEEIENKKALIQIHIDIYLHSNIHAFDIEDTENKFISPIGIVKDTNEGEYDYEQIQEGFVTYREKENDEFKLEMVISKPNLIDVYLQSIHLLPSVDNFWIVIHPFWDNKRPQVWVNPHLKDSKMVTSFLRSESKNTIENGYVELVVYSSKGETTITLDDHKKIQISTKEDSVLKSIIDQYEIKGYRRLRNLYNLEIGFHHWHYRPEGSLTRTELCFLMEQHQFDQLDPKKINYFLIQ